MKMIVSTGISFEIAPFFVPWFKALVLIAERDFTKEKYEDTSLLNAAKLFDEAFDNKYLIERFCEAGADSTQESVIGSVKTILSGIKIIKGD